jgi:hypothetical protein
MNAPSSTTGSITVAGATAIGVGGMMGAGLYTLVGLASTTAGVWVPLAFLVGGAVSVFSVYSYAKLGARYPSRGGAAQFLIRCFGDGVIAGGLNIFQFLGWTSRWRSTAPGSRLRPGTAAVPDPGLVGQGHRHRHRSDRRRRRGQPDRHQIRRPVRAVRGQHRVGDPGGVRRLRPDPF